MKTFNIHEAKTHLSQLIAQVEAGEEVVIARAGTPVVRLVLIQETRGKRRFGQEDGVVQIPDDFDEPLDPAVWGNLFE